MRKGYTTGTCAAAAAKAAAQVLKSGVRSQEGSPANQRFAGAEESGVDRKIEVEIVLPKGEIVKFEAHIKDVGEDYAVASVIKDAGDDPDVTGGAEIVARVTLKESGVRGQESGGKDKIIIKGGKGVGVVTKPGLQVPAGEPAINPVPRRMIKDAVKEVLGDATVEVTIEVPDGEKLAEKTFNPRLGIRGGISIIGTTGIVEPMSLEALKATVQCEIDVALAEVGNRKSEFGSQVPKIYFSPGKIGEDALRRIFGDIRVVQTSNFVGFALQYAKDRGVKEVVFGGHPGKLAKILMGYYDTHSRNSPQATRFVSEFLGIEGEFNTVEEIIEAIGKRQEATGFDRLAEEIAKKISEDFSFIHTGVYLFDMKKTLIGEGRWDG
ncbi:MAG TPA: cobalamin biosynthesis protein CbiD [Nitrospirae bacterium]|nr:cobalamin biosynthesis protein CbiD [Nitrospirota bacterium]